MHDLDTLVRLNLETERKALQARLGECHEMDLTLPLGPGRPFGLRHRIDELVRKLRALGVALLEYGLVAVLLLGLVASCRPREQDPDRSDPYPPPPVTLRGAKRAADGTYLIILQRRDQ